MSADTPHPSEPQGCVKLCLCRLEAIFASLVYNITVYGGQRLMIDSTDSFANKLQFIFAGFLVLAILTLLALISLTSDTSTAQAKSTSRSARPVAPNMSNDPNVIASGMAVASFEIGQALDSTAQSINSAAHTTASAASNTGQSIARGTQTGVVTIANGISSGLSSVGRVVSSGFSFLIDIPQAAIAMVADTSVVSSFIRPSEHIEVPIIDPDSPELRTALAAMPATSPASPKSSVRPQWPIHGAITTHFGVSHWPYQYTHSGIDISDGLAPGITPVKPFRPGKVVDTVSSSYGLGNHVRVDHGNGVTSVYAHLSSISVQVGQKVDTDTVLGHEGSTGVSTGTHLHFEILVNGKAANPMQFISGQP